MKSKEDLFNTAGDAVNIESAREKLDNIPLSEDVEFLEAIKEELLGLKKRLRHETLQKLQLLKQIKEFKTRESELIEKAERLAIVEEGKCEAVDAGTQYDI